MIKLLRLVLVLALTLPVISIIPKSLYAQTAQPTPPPLTGSTSISCNNFASDLYYKLEYPAMIGSRYAYVNPVYVTFKKDMNTLHQILASKSISVSDSEKGNTPKFGKSTTEAVIQFQEQFKSQIGLTRPSGIVDEKTRQYLNQQYGCIDKALVTLTEPNKNTIRARGESLAIKWTASKIPNTTDITIKYVNSTNPSASSTIITLPNIRNGKGEYLWTIPSTLPAGSYKIVVALTGSVKSDESNAPFEVRETALEILTPNTEVGLLPGGRLPITWKTSTALKPSDKIKINLQGTLISDGQSLINVEIAKVPNTGSYIWTVPDRINNKIVTSTSAFSIILKSEVGNYTSTSSPVVQLKPASSVQTSSVALSQPTSGAQYQTDQTIPVRWTSKGLKTTDDVQILLIAKTGANAGTYIIGNTKNNGVFNWVIPTSIGSFNLATTTLNQYQVLIVPTANTAVRATSSTFSIVPVPPPAPVVLPKITIGTVPTTFEKGVPFALTWTSNSTITTLGKVKIELVNADTGLVVETLATNVSPNANTYPVMIPTRVVASSTSSHKFRITPLSGLVNLDPASVLNSQNFHINTPVVQMTATLDKTSVVKGNPLVVSFTGSVPTLSRVIATIVKPDNSPVVGSPTINTAMGSSRATLPVPASLPVGQYKIYLSSTVNGVLVQAYSPEFAVVNPNPVFTIDGTPVISNIFGNTGKTTSLTAVFNMKAQANGAILAKLAPTNFTVVFQDDVTGSTTPASTVVVTSASVANGATGNVKVTATIQNAPLTTSGYFKAKINGITWAMGTAPNTTTGTETAGLTAFVTPRIVFVK